MKISFLGLFLGLLISGKITAAVPKIVFHVSTQTTSNHPDILRDENGDALSSGAARNGDGDLITLGYYDEADSTSITNHFKGNWVPLTEGTRVGDSSTGYGFNDGMFSFTSTFTRNTDVVDIFPSEPAFYQLFSHHVISDSLPVPGTPICIRFYNAPELSETTKYNAVTGPDWVWPNFSSGIPVNYYLKISKGFPPFNSKWKYGSDLEFPNDSFKTTELIEYIPTLYDLIVTHNQGGSVNDVNASYPEDSSVEIIASPDPHMEFVGWVGAGVSDPLFPNTVVFMTEDRNISAIFQPKNYELNISMNGTGETSGKGEYPYGQFVNITATPSLGFEFSHWEGLNIENNMSGNTRVEILQDTQIKAVFVPKEQTFNIYSSNPAFGSVYIVQNGPYRNGSKYDIFAEPQPGYYFSHWSSTNDALYMLDSNTSVTTEVNLVDDAIIFGNFYEISYALEILNGAGGHSVSPTSGNYGVNQIIPINAVPAEGYNFNKWHDPGGIVLDPYSSSTDVNMSKATGNQTLLANYYRKNYNISITAGNGGNVIFDSPNGPWYHFEKYTIQATPNAGYKFISWNGSQTSIDSLTLDNNISTNQISVTGDVSLNAHFMPENYSVALSSGEGGSVSGSGIFSVENIPEISATADPGWIFSHWEGNQTHLVYLSTTTNPISLIDLADAPPALSFEAIFKRPIYTLTVQSSDGGLVDNQVSYTIEAEGGTEFSLHASSNEGWSFDQWFGMGSEVLNEDTLTFTLNSDLDIEANFKINSYNLHVSSSEFGQASGSGSYQYGSSIEVVAEPIEGYTFEKWTGDIEHLDSPIQSSTFAKIPSRDISITPIFKVIPITVSIDVKGDGSVSGAGFYDPETPFTLEANGNPSSQSAPRGYGLLRWSWSDASGNSLTSTQNPLTLSSKTDITLEAEFYPIPPNDYNLELLVSPNQGGFVFDDPDYRVWNIDTDTIDRKVSVTPNNGYSFLGWTSDANVSFSPNWKSSVVIISPDKNSSITANLEPVSYDLNIIFDPLKGSMENLKSEYSHHDLINLKAVPHDLFEFSHWEIIKEQNYRVTSNLSKIDSSHESLSINGKESAKLTLVRGFTYKFDVNLSNNNKFFISEVSSSNDPEYEEFTLGVENSMISNGTLTLTVQENTPNTLFYHSTDLNTSGGLISVISKNDSDIVENALNPDLTLPTFCDLVLEAHFRAVPYNSDLSTHKLEVTVANPNEGSISSDKSDYNHLETAEIKSFPSEHYEFSHWEVLKDHQFSVHKTESTINATYDVLQIDNQHAPHLTLVRGHSYEFDVNLENDEKFYISEKFNEDIIFSDEYVSGITNSRVSQGKLLFSVNENTPDILYYKSSIPETFGGLIKIITLEDDVILQDKHSANIYPSLVSDLALVAHFSPINYSISITSDDGGTIQEVSGSYTHTDKVEIEATPAKHYKFSRWEGSEFIEDHLSKKTILKVAEDTYVKAIFEPILYPLNLSVEPKGTATFKITDNKTSFPFGTSIVVEAIPVTGYRFMHWEGDTEDTSNSVTTITTTESTNLKAIIATEPLRIDINVETLDYLEIPETLLTGGNAIGPDILQRNKPASFTATPKEGYDFVGWFDESGNPLSSNQDATLSFLESGSITARFKQKAYKLNIFASPKYFGTVKWDDTVSLEELSYTLPHGYDVNITASALEKNRFVSWDIKKSDTTHSVKSKELAFALKENTELIANFESAPMPYLTIEVSPSTAGKVIGNGYKSTSELHNIFASPNNGYKFDKWVGNSIADPINPITTISFDKNTTIKAFFIQAEKTTESEPEETEYVLEVQPSNKNHGNTNPSGTNIYANGRISIMAEPKPGYIFSHWDGENIENKNKSSTFVNLSKDTLIAAIFEKANTSQKYIKVDKSVKTYDYLEEQMLEDEEGGSILGGTSFAVGFEPTFKIHLKSGYEFLRWENDYEQVLSTSSEIQFDSETDFSLVAVFKKKAYEINILTQPQGIALIDWDGLERESAYHKVLPHGAVFSLTAMDSKNYKFNGWNSNEIEIENSKEPLLTVIPTSDITLTANYMPLNSIRLKTEVFPEDSGWIIGGGEFSYNPNHLVFAKANPGYKFDRWEGTQISDKLSQETSINLDQDLNLRAVFIPDISYTGGSNEHVPGLHSLTVVSNDMALGTVSGSGVYGTGWVTIKATAKENYVFSHWEGLGLADSFTSKTQVLLESDAIVTAYFRNKTLFSKSEPYENSWYSSAWFGTYWNVHPKKWAYHLNLGWLYVHEIEESSYWVWINRLNNWYWIRKESFPYIFESSTESWFFLMLDDESISNEIILYGFRANAWRKME